MKQVIQFFSDRFNANPLDERHAIRRVFNTLRVILAVAVVGTIGYTCGKPSHIYLALLIAAGGVVGGSFLGFLFGIPRSNGLGTDGNSYQPNTNLEEVSDWLTKIIIGVSLVEMRSILRHLDLLVGRLAIGFPGHDASYTFVWALVLFYFFFGLVGGYLITRIFLPVVFAKADHGAALNAADAERIAKRVVNESSGLNAHAMQLVEYQLGEGHSFPAVDQEELNKALMETTPNGRSSIFFQTRRFRMEKEKEERAQRQSLERAIPVFTALIKEDEHSGDPKFHTNYAQRAFVYLALPEPDYGNAKIDLDKAIALRDKFKVPDHRHYELLRAMCNIHTAKLFNTTGKRTHEEIQKDLKYALAMHSGVELKPDQCRIVKEWMAEHQIQDPVIDRAVNNCLG